jgi:hypothetical protein
MAEAWLRRLLFWGNLALAAGLAALVLVTPWLSVDESSGTVAWLVARFGHDAALRRTCLATAVGLAVTACVFFQPARRSARPPRRPPSDVAGA